MATRIIRAVPRSVFNLSGLKAGGLAAIGITGPIDVREYTEITAYVRFHQGTIVANEPTLAQIQFYADGETDQDPGALNAATPPGLAFVSLAAFTGFADMKTVAPPKMKVTALPSNVGSAIALALVVVASATVGTLNYLISVDLICKNSDPGPDYVAEREPLLSEVMD